MMEIGIFARTFPGNLDDVLDAVAASGIRCVHFNLKCAAGATMPDRIDDALCAAVRDGFARRELRMIGLSAALNAIHPDPRRREADIRRAITLIGAAAKLGANLVTVCSGSRDADDMWRAHPDNDAADAWDDLQTTLAQLLPVAERAGVTIGIEPERANVINTALKARRLLDHWKSPRLKIIMDGANLFDIDERGDMRPRLVEAFDLLGDDIAQVHAKDITDDLTKKDQAAGTGRLDWHTYFDQIARVGYDGPIVLHNLSPAQVAASSAFVRGHIDRIMGKTA